MKAIVITFEGAICKERELIKNLADVIQKFTHAEEVNLDLLNDRELTTILTEHVVKTKIKKDPKPEVIRDFCKKIIAETGSPALKRNEILCKDICEYLIKQNRAVIASPVCIIANIATEPNKKEYENILAEYGLTILPGLLRDINPIFKFY